MSKRPSRKSKNRAPKPSRAPKPGAVTAAVTVSYEHLVPQLTDELDRRGGLAWERHENVRRIVTQVLAGRADARIRITGDMAATIADCDSTTASEYTRDRGANLVVGKTMPAADGSFDIALAFEMFFNLEADPLEEVQQQTQQLLHVAAHEPQHALQHITATTSADYRENVACSRTPRAFRIPLGEAVEEFRCELAANAYVLNKPSRESKIGEDLEHTRSEFNRALPLIRSDIRQAVYITMTAAKELIKALAYLAAEILAVTYEFREPIPKPSGWDRYLAEYWPAFFDIMRTVPPADTSATRAELSAALEALCILTSEWLADVGIDYTNDATLGESCYWKHNSY